MSAVSSGQFSAISWHVIENQCKLGKQVLKRMYALSVCILACEYSIYYNTGTLGCLWLALIWAKYCRVYHFSQFYFVQGDATYYLLCSQHMEMYENLNNKLS